MAFKAWFSTGKVCSLWGQRFAKEKQKVKGPVLPVRNPFKPVWLPLLEMIGCVGEGQQQTGDTQMGYLQVGEQMSLSALLSATQDARCTLSFLLHHVLFDDKTSTKMSLKQNTGASMGSLLEGRRRNLSGWGLGLSHRVKLPLLPFSHQ